jgi:hypothetical protein
LLRLRTLVEQTEVKVTPEFALSGAAHIRNADIPVRLQAAQPACVMRTFLSACKRRSLHA